jgi:anti-sigma regulatory factor (Ser/Thr protein kinase)
MREGAQGSDDIALLAVRLVRARVDALHLNVAAKPEQLASIRSSLRSWLALAGVAAHDVDEVVLAAGEACANAIEHAYTSARKEGTVAVDARFVDGDELVVAVRDTGHWRTGAASLHRGRGLGIMRALASTVDVESEGDGTTITMRRHMRRKGRA